MRKLRVAVIGTGQIVQWAHIPYLRELDDRFEIVAACDISRKVVDRVGSFFQIPAVFTDYREMLAATEPEVCLITTHDHYEPALAALEAGAHLLIEKPMCLLLDEARHVVERACELKRVVQVAYHKRYDPNYLRGLELMQGVSDRRQLYLRCIIGPNSYYTDDFWPGWRYDDAPPMPSPREKVRQALGEAAPEALVAAYQLMTGLSTHTFSILRGLYPNARPKVHACMVAGQGRGYTALLEMPDGLPVTINTGVINVKDFDEEMSLFGFDQVVRIHFPSPYLKNAATEVSLQAMNGRERTETHYLTSNDEAYKREWEAFYEAVAHGAPVATPPEEGVMDLELTLQLLEAASRAH